MLIPHDWLYPPSPLAAKAIQQELAKRVIVDDQIPRIDLIGGMDVSNNIRDPAQMIYATVITLNGNDFTLMEVGNNALRQPFPYIPGLLGFREAPALIQAVKQLKVLPDIILVDGHGISHPRRLGIASHLGVLLERPTIGVAKSILVGYPEKALGDTAGSRVRLLWQNQQIGTVLRTKKGCNPLYISPGHKVSHETAVELVLSYCRGYRLPEPTRLAHQASNAFRRKMNETA